MLFVHGTADSIVSPAQSLRAYELAASAPGAALALLEGAGHLFAGYEEDLADLIAQWLAQVFGEDVAA
jgi:fermentation-respiration switch protein FrsA (DUF1100 family)